MKLNRKATIYSIFLSLAAIVLYSYLIFNYSLPDYKIVLPWILISAIIESLLIKLPNDQIGISVGYAINMAALIVGGPLMVATVVPLGVLFRMPKIDGRGYVHVFNIPLYKTIYNVSQFIVVSSLMGLLYVYLGGKIGVLSLFPALIVVFGGILLNSFMITGFLYLMTNGNFVQIWKGNTHGILRIYIVVGIIGVLIALVYLMFGVGSIVLFLAPLLLIRHLLKLYVDTLSNYIDTMQLINKLIEAKDPYTSGHASRVQELSVKLAHALNLKPSVVDNISKAAILHDLGKIGINDTILNKPDKLTDLEYQEIKKHSQLGAEIVQGVNFLKESVDIVLYHHERYDGRGYPKGLSGSEIPVEACIVAIADSYDAMTSSRPYRDAMSKEVALKELEINAGKQFHPELAMKFIKIMNN